VTRGSKTEKTIFGKSTKKIVKNKARAITEMDGGEGVQVKIIPEKKY